MNLNVPNIKLKMTEQNLNIKDLAKKMELSRQWVGVNLQRGYSNNNFIHLLAKALNVEIKEIVKLDE